MNKWIIANREELKTAVAPPQPEGRPRTIKLEFFLSPSETPIAVRGLRDKNRNVLIIQFAYSDLEVPDGVNSIVSNDKVITLLISKQSNRILALEIDVSKFGNSNPNVGLEFHKRQVQVLAHQLRGRALDVLKQKERDKDQHQPFNFLATERVLETKAGEEVFREIAESAL